VFRCAVAYRADVLEAPGDFRAADGRSSSPSPASLFFHIYFIVGVETRERSAAYVKNITIKHRVYRVMQE
jgi:hypothetical protein